MRLITGEHGLFSVQLIMLRSNTNSCADLCVSSSAVVATTLEVHSVSPLCQCELSKHSYFSSQMKLMVGWVSLDNAPFHALVFHALMQHEAQIGALGVLSLLGS
jgi:hypothetical protein